jgi:hypothetical protein
MLCAPSEHMAGGAVTGALEAAQLMTLAVHRAIQAHHELVDSAAVTRERGGGRPVKLRPLLPHYVLDKKKAGRRVSPAMTPKGTSSDAGSA